MMTCDSCQVCPIPLKRSRNVQVDPQHPPQHRVVVAGVVSGEDVSVAVVPRGASTAPVECPGCDNHPRLRKSPPLHHPPTLSLSLGRQLKRQQQQQQHSPSTQAAPRHRNLTVSIQGATTFVMTSSSCGGSGGGGGGGGGGGRAGFTEEAEKAGSAVRLGVVDAVDCHELAALLDKRDDLLIIDSRSFMDYNTHHIRCAVNVANSKIGKRRLQQERVSVRDLLVNNCDADSYNWAVLYDVNSRTIAQLPADSFQAILLEKLAAIFPRVSLLNGGFSEFQSCYPSLVEDKQRPCAPLASTLSQPCMPTTNAGLTRILPFLYLGSQQDAHNRQLLWDHNIKYVLNVSATCPKADFIPEPQFLRIAVNDNYSEKLLPHFSKASHFVERARESGGCVIVHCLAGVSRSPTMAIAYVMKHLRMTSDEAYRYVKSKRPTISPNFNFLGQLLEYEKQLRREKVLEASADLCSSAPVVSPSRPLTPSSGLTLSPTRERDLPAVSQKKQRLSPRTAMLPRQLTLTLKRPMETVQASPPEGNSPASGAVSPTTGIARLNFGGSQESLSVPGPTRPFEVARSLSCNLEWLGTHEDENLPPQEIERNLSLSPGTERPAELLPGYHLQPLQQSYPAAQAAESSTGKRKDHLFSKALSKTLSAASLRRHLRRSDSVSTSGTSGYGSQISDHLDTLEDDILSDSDESAVVMRTPHPQGDHGHSKISRHDSAYRSMTFDESFAVGSRDCKDKEQQKCKPLGSPLSPSEQHLVADFEIDTPLEVDHPLQVVDSSAVEHGCHRGADTRIAPLWSSQCSGSHIELESSHDSGYITSISSTSSSLTSSMRSSVMSSSGSSACGRRITTATSTTDSWRSQCSSVHAELESSQESGIAASMTSSTSSMRSSCTMSSPGSSTYRRLRAVFCSREAAAAAAANIDAEMELTPSKLSQEQQGERKADLYEQIIAQFEATRTITERQSKKIRQLQAEAKAKLALTSFDVDVTRVSNRMRQNDDPGRQMALPRTRSLPGLEALRGGESTSGSSYLPGQQPRNRHSYSGAVDLNRESPGSPAPARIAVSIAVS